MVYPLHSLDSVNGLSVEAQVLHGDKIGVWQGVILALEGVEQIVVLLPIQALNGYLEAVILWHEHTLGDVVQRAELLPHLYGSKRRQALIEIDIDGVV